MMDEGKIGEMIPVIIYTVVLQNFSAIWRQTWCTQLCCKPPCWIYLPLEVKCHSTWSTKNLIHVTVIQFRWVNVDSLLCTLWQDIAYRHAENLWKSIFGPCHKHDKDVCAFSSNSAQTAKAQTSLRISARRIIYVRCRFHKIHRLIWADMKRSFNPAASIFNMLF